MFLHPLKHLRKPRVLSPLRSSEVDLVPLACEDAVEDEFRDLSFFTPPASKNKRKHAKQLNTEVLKIIRQPVY